ncbi:MAG: PIN domain-containing protein [Nanoarchaeota archaeon]|nr:PIN domain-containing protein [Nanoarchaeota archaeon]
MNVNQSTKSSISFIDANILGYAYERSNLQKHNIAAHLLRPCWQTKTKFALSTQILGEFFTLITKKVKKSLDTRIAQIIITDIIDLPYWKVLSYNEKTVIMALDIASNFGMPYWDSLIAATMTEHDISTIYTENIKDFKVPWIKAISPFKIRL